MQTHRCTLPQAGAFKQPKPEGEGAEGAAQPAPIPPFITYLRDMAAQVLRAQQAMGVVEVPERPVKKARTGDEKEEGGLMDGCFPPRSLIRLVCPSTCLPSCFRFK